MSHVQKPASDILCDYVDALMSATTFEQLGRAREQALLEFRCSWGLSSGEASPLLTAAVTIAAMSPGERQAIRDSISRKEAPGARAPESAPAANFV